MAAIRDIKINAAISLFVNCKQINREAINKSGSIELIPPL